MHTKSNTVIKIYGSLCEKWDEINETFDWSKILSASNDFKVSESNFRVFELHNVADITAHEKHIAVHAHYSVWSQVEKALTDAVADYYHCRSFLMRRMRSDFNDNYIVYLYNPALQTRFGLRTGDKIRFGIDPCSAGTGDSGDIVWIVLDICNDEALLITEKTVRVSGYCDSSIANGNWWYLMWGNSLAREVCNGQFFHEVFNQQMKNCIVPQKIDEAQFGPVCTDEVFLLSEAQVNLFFPTEESRKAHPSERLIAQQDQVKYIRGDGMDKSCTAWWLLPEEEGHGLHTSIYPKAVWPNGIIQFHGRNVYHSDFTIRPCIVVTLSEEFVERYSLR